MLIVALIELPDTDPTASTGTYGDAPDVIATAVLARVEQECGYDDNGNPYGPGEVVVHALTTAPTEVFFRSLDHVAAATARGHGPL